MPSFISEIITKGFDKKNTEFETNIRIISEFLRNWKLFPVIWCMSYSVNQNGMEERAGKRERTSFDHSFFNWQVDKFFGINFIGETFLCMWSFLVNENSALNTTLLWNMTKLQGNSFCGLICYGLNWNYCYVDNIFIQKLQFHCSHQLQ